MARRKRITKLVNRFTVDPGDNRVESRPFVQNNGNGTFSFSTGTNGIIFSLSDTDLLDLITDRRKQRIILEMEPPPEPPAKKQRKKTSS